MNAKHILSQCCYLTIITPTNKLRVSAISRLNASQGGCPHGSSRSNNVSEPLHVALIRDRVKVSS